MEKDKTLRGNSEEETESSMSNLCLEEKPAVARLLILIPQSSDKGSWDDFGGEGISKELIWG